MNAKEVENIEASYNTGGCHAHDSRLASAQGINYCI